MYYQLCGNKKIWFEVLISEEERILMQQTVCIGVPPPESVHSRSCLILSNPILEAVIASSEIEGEIIPEWAKHDLRNMYPTRYH